MSVTPHLKAANPQTAAKRARPPRSTRPNDRHSIIVGIDTGGTFTDLVAIVDGRLARPQAALDAARSRGRGVRGAEAILDGAAAPGAITYSSTVATNALLESKGARVALFTNAGFEDLIEIGRQNRSDLYALAPSGPSRWCRARLRFGVGEPHLLRRHDRDAA